MLHSCGSYAGADISQWSLDRYRSFDCPTDLLGLDLLRLFAVHRADGARPGLASHRNERCSVARLAGRRPVCLSGRPLDRCTWRALADDCWLAAGRPAVLCMGERGVTADPVPGLGGLGAAMAATLYDPVFAVLTRLYPASFRKKIILLTLVGGFASTVFIPLTQYLMDQIGWRTALMRLGLMHLLICAPLHFAALRDRLPKGVAAGSGAELATISRASLARAAASGLLVAAALVGQRQLHRRAAGHIASGTGWRRVFPHRRGACNTSAWPGLMHCRAHHGMRVYLSDFLAKKPSSGGLATADVQP